jgi:hypothetical protein
MKVKDLAEGYYEKVVIQDGRGGLRSVRHNVKVIKRPQQKYLLHNSRSNGVYFSYGEGTVVANVSMVSPIK